MLGPVGMRLAAAQAPERKIALVIGNARYPAIPLPNPENDARLISTTLRTLGFDVNQQLNLKVRDFRRELREFSRRMQDEEGVAVLFYAGHGLQMDGRNYLLPVDINLRDQEEIKDESVDIDELFISRIDRARTKARIVILDACRDNPFEKRTRAVNSSAGLAEMAARGTLIAYSSAPGAPAEDGPEGGSSIYTGHLAREMMVQGVEVEQMFKRVRVKVLRDTQDRQIPWVNTSLTVNFSFNPGPQQLAADAAAVAAAEERQKLRDELERTRKALSAAQARRDDPAAGQPAKVAGGEPSKAGAADAPKAVEGPKATDGAKATDGPKTTDGPKVAEATPAKAAGAEPIRPPPEPSRPATTEPAKVASVARRGIDIALRADQSLNTDARNLSAPVAIRIYLLRSPSAFRSADFVSLFERDQAILGRDLISREEMFLRPGQVIRLSRELTPDVRSIAVFAAFREFGSATWRALDAAPTAAGSGEEGFAPIRIEVGARDIRIVAKP